MKYTWKINGFEGSAEAPANDEEWTAQQLADYLGLIRNDKDGPPYLFSTSGGLVQVVREQIIKTIEQMLKPPTIVMPGSPFRKQ